MLLFSLHETLWMLLAAIVLDRLIGDPPWPTHPVIRIGQLIKRLESMLRKGEPTEEKGVSHSTGGDHAESDDLLSSAAPNPAVQRWKGVLLAGLTVAASTFAVWLVVWGCKAIHPWLGYAANTWFIASTIAIKGLKGAAMQVYTPLVRGDLAEARQYTGYIVGRETDNLDERELARATVETVAENTVDAVVSPLFYALLGGAPLAMAYRATNTLDSMVGYRNDRYLYFGWASARLDDVLNWIPARLTGFLLLLAALLTRSASPKRGWASVRHFARLHPSPNSGIPEAAVAGALGIELGGRNVYGGRVSERARMGWPLAELARGHILQTAGLLVRVSDLLAGGLIVWIVIERL